MTLSGFPCLPFFELDPLLEPVRRSPEFASLISELRVEHEGYRRLYAGLQTQSGEASEVRS